MKKIIAGLLLSFTSLFFSANVFAQATPPPLVPLTPQEITTAKNLIKNFTVSITPVDSVNKPGLYNVTWNNAGQIMRVSIDKRLYSEKYISQVRVANIVNGKKTFEYFENMLNDAGWGTYIFGGLLKGNSGTAQIQLVPARMANNFPLSQSEVINGLKTILTFDAGYLKPNATGYDYVYEATKSSPEISLAPIGIKSNQTQVPVVKIGDIVSIPVDIGHLELANFWPAPKDNQDAKIGRFINSPVSVTIIDNIESYRERLRNRGDAGENIVYQSINAEVLSFDGKNISFKIPESLGINGEGYYQDFTKMIPGVYYVLISSSHINPFVAKIIVTGNGTAPTSNYMKILSATEQSTVRAKAKNFSVSVVPVDAVNKPGLYNVTWNNAGQFARFEIDSKNTYARVVPTVKGASLTAFDVPSNVLSGNNGTRQIQLIRSRLPSVVTAPTNETELNAILSKREFGTVDFKFTPMYRGNYGPVFLDSNSKTIKNVNLPIAGVVSGNINKTTAIVGETVKITPNTNHLNFSDILSALGCPKPGFEILSDCLNNSFYFRIQSVSALPMFSDYIDVVAADSDGFSVKIPNSTMYSPAAGRSVYKVAPGEYYIKNLFDLKSFLTKITVVPGDTSALTVTSQATPSTSAVGQPITVTFNVNSTGTYSINLKNTSGVSKNIGSLVVNTVGSVTKEIILPPEIFPGIYKVLVCKGSILCAQSDAIIQVTATPAPVTYSWLTSPTWSSCDALGVKTRTVTCKASNGSTASSESLCTAPKPAVTSTEGCTVTPGASITVTSQDVPSTLVLGQPLTVRFNTTRTGNHDISLAISPSFASSVYGLGTHNITSAGINTKTITVSAGSVPAGTYWAQVCSNYPSRVCDQSAAIIQVTATPAPVTVTPTINITSPNGGQAWRTGQNQTINWNYTGTNPLDRIFLYLQYPDGRRCMLGENTKEYLTGQFTFFFNDTAARCTRGLSTIVPGSYKVAASFLPAGVPHTINYDGSDPLALSPGDISDGFINVTIAPSTPTVTYSWLASPTWSSCIAAGFKTRTVTCKASTGATASSESLCTAPKPAVTSTEGCTIVSPADTTAPTITSVSASGVTQTGATITWTTNEASNSSVNYGTAVTYGSTATGPSSVTSHYVTLSGLTPNTTYNFRVKSTDTAGNNTYSGNFTFRTVATIPSTQSLSLTLPTTSFTKNLTDFGPTVNYSFTATIPVTRVWIQLIDNSGSIKSSAGKGFTTATLSGSGTFSIPSNIPGGSFTVKICDVSSGAGVSATSICDTKSISLITTSASVSREDQIASLQAALAELLRQLEESVGR